VLFEGGVIGFLIFSVFRPMRISVSVLDSDLDLVFFSSYFKIKTRFPTITIPFALLIFNSNVLPNTFLETRFISEKTQLGYNL
jgi:hypothetical protein